MGSRSYSCHHLKSNKTGQGRDVSSLQDQKLVPDRQTKKFFSGTGAHPRVPLLDAFFTCPWVFRDNSLIALKLGFSVFPLLNFNSIYLVGKKHPDSTFTDAILHSEENGFLTHQWHARRLTYRAIFNSGL